MVFRKLCVTVFYFLTQNNSKVKIAENRILSHSGSGTWQLKSIKRKYPVLLGEFFTYLKIFLEK